eukprot:Opistho-2@4848
MESVQFARLVDGGKVAWKHHPQLWRTRLHARLCNGVDDCVPFAGFKQRRTRCDEATERHCGRARCLFFLSAYVVLDESEKEIKQLILSLPGDSLGKNAEKRHRLRECASKVVFPIAAVLVTTLLVACKVVQHCHKSHGKESLDESHRHQFAVLPQHFEESVNHTRLRLWVALEHGLHKPLHNVSPRTGKSEAGGQIGGGIRVKFRKLESHGGPQFFRFLHGRVPAPLDGVRLQFRKVFQERDEQVDRLLPAPICTIAAHTHKTADGFHAGVQKHLRITTDKLFKYREHWRPRFVLKANAAACPLSERRTKR